MFVRMYVDNEYDKLSRLGNDEATGFRGGDGAQAPEESSIYLPFANI